MKTKSFIKWALDHFEFDYLLKCDDDTYVCLERLLEARLTGDYVGRDLGGFASGGAGYLVSRRAAEVLASEMRQEAGPEDVFAARSLFKAGIKLIHDERFSPGGPAPGPSNQLITGHYCTPQQMVELHRKLHGRL